MAGLIQIMTVLIEILMVSFQRMNSTPMQWNIPKAQIHVFQIQTYVKMALAVLMECMMVGNITGVSILFHQIPKRIWITIHFQTFTSMITCLLKVKSFHYTNLVCELIGNLTVPIHSQP